MPVKPWLYIHTLRYLKPVQIFGRVFYRLYRPRITNSTTPDIRKCPGECYSPVPKLQSLFELARFRFLNETHEVQNSTDWNNPTWSKLWLYNLHYFDDLNAVKAEERSAWHTSLIERWINENPVGRGNGWEPYPTSLRIVNWIKWAFAGNRLSGAAIRSLAVQARYLSKRIEYHLLGNHLFANAKALLFAGLFFEGAEADRWFKKGFDILSEQIPEQVLPDGGHFERSPMYHSIILEDLLDLINLMQTYGKEIPPLWGDAVVKMASWLEGMVHPDGEIVLFNDAAFGIAPKPKAILAYTARFGYCEDKTVHEGVKYFDSTGYMRVQKGGAVAFLDTAPIGPDYLPGHAHADTLTFELSLFGQRVIVDSGTSTYEKNAERQRQRGTSAHNTVTLNSEGSSEVWGGFRVARRAYPHDITIEESIGEIRVSGSHDGCCWLPGKPIHKRDWVFKENSLQITDRIDGHFEEATGRFYVHPDLKLECMDACEGAILFLDGKEVSWKVTGGKCNVENSTWHPEFGLSIANSCLVIRFESPEASIVFTW